MAYLCECPADFRFHYLIAHSFITLKPKFYINEVIIVSVTCIKLAQVKHQLSPTAINSNPAVYFCDTNYRPVSILSSIAFVKLQRQGLSGGCQE